MDEKQRIRNEAIGRRDALDPEVRSGRCPSANDELIEAFDRALYHYRNVSGDPDVCYRQEPFTVAVYSAMKSEVSLAAFVEHVYDRDAVVCFPCMTKHAPEDIDPESTSTGDQTVPRKKSFMAMRKVPRERYECDEVPFLISPLTAFVADDPALDGYPLIDPPLIDMVIVPLVAFDDANNRLGYGGGNYDRLLPTLRDDAAIIGVAFDEQRIESVPCEPHDMVLPHIVTC